MATKNDSPPPVVEETGLAGGPGPTPPGVDDGTPKPAVGAEEPPLAARPQQRAGEIAERSAGTRQEDVAAAERERAKEKGRRDPEEPDPS